MRAFVLAVLILMVAAAVATLALRPSRTPVPPPQAPTGRLSAAPTSAQMQPESQGQVFLVDTRANLLAPVGVALPKESGSKAEAVLRALLTTKPPEGMVSGIPKGTRLLAVKREGDTAIVNLSREFADGLPAGSNAAYLTVMQVVSTLTYVEGVRKVAFEIEGKKVRALGQVDVRQPLERDNSVLEHQGK